MNKSRHSSDYDAVVVGAGHNGLVAACYLALAGRRVLILEKNDHVGGATRSQRLFQGVDARLSVYAYLVSLLPRQILRDLGLRFETRRRAVAAYAPALRNGVAQGLLISNVEDDRTRQSFAELTGSDREYRGYQKLHEIVGIFAEKVWPTLLEPLTSRQVLKAKFRTAEERQAWEYLVEKPLSALIEDHLYDDSVRGLVFTDAKIGVLTYPEDPTLLQNRTFIYHTIGQGTGEWQVPVGGMGALVEALADRARSLGVAIETSAEVVKVDPGKAYNEVHFEQDGVTKSVKARDVLFNAPSTVANRCLPGAYDEQMIEGSVFKINLVLKRLPELIDTRISAQEAFTGTFHLDEGYAQMQATYRAAQAAAPFTDLAGEMYCHSLTDPSILSEELQRQGYQTLTLFGLDVPYHWFVEDNDGVKEQIVRQYRQAINRVTQEDLFDLLAVDSSGQPCIDAQSPLDLERSLGLPKGNIFHGNLTWPFAEQDAEAGTWGVETGYDHITICGSSARRGGAVSGLPGHHAAMRVLGYATKQRAG